MTAREPLTAAAEEAMADRGDRDAELARAWDQGFEARAQWARAGYRDFARPTNPHRSTP